MTSLLTLSTQHAKSQASLPPVSYLKAVDAFMSVCTVFVFMALMEYCLVNIVLGKVNECQRLVMGNNCFSGDSPTPKVIIPPPPPKDQNLEKFFTAATSKMSVKRNPSKVSSTIQLSWLTICNDALSDYRTDDVRPGAVSKIQQTPHTLT